MTDKETHRAQGTGAPGDTLFPKGPPTQFQLRDITTLNSGMIVAGYTLA